MLYVFLLGLAFGSFANVVNLRYNTGESLVWGGSRCFFCARRLRWFELVPVFSFLALGRRCRTCGTRISLQYPAVEILSGLLFAAAYAYGPGGLWLKALWAAFFWFLLVISIYDARHFVIPDGLVYSASLVAVLGAALRRGNLGDAGRDLLMGVLLFLIFALLWKVSRGRWMGFGDAKLAFAAGVFSGWPAALAAFLGAFWLGALYGLALVLVRRIPHLKVPIPFGPFLSAGALVAALWGEHIVVWYLSFF